MGTSGVGSADLVTDGGTTVPVVNVRIFTDGGAAGTIGYTEPVLAPEQALQAGESDVLIAPPDAEKYRYNIAIRTLDQGATLTATLQAADGTVLTTVQKSYPATYFEQVDARTFLGGVAPASNSSIVIQISSGSAILAGATVDNTTNDPSAQFTQRSH